MSRTLKKDQINWKAILRINTWVQIVVGVSLAVFAMRGFMIPNRFMDGGVTGISILISETYHSVHISLLVLLFNILFIYLGYKKIGKTFAVITTIAVILLAVGLYVIEFEPVTTDKFLIAVIGGVLMGAGVGFVIRSGGVIDGAEVIAVFTKRKTGFSNSEIILLFNTVIFSLAAIGFGLETAMYSIITYFTASKATEYVVDGIEEFTAIHIVSAFPEEIKQYLVNELGKGITVYNGKRGYLPGSFDIKADCEIIVTVVSRLEITKVNEGILQIDPKAFVYIQQVKEASGGVLKMKNHAH
jgi:uncharacterized membrane-anchored protein YitT (DUF2179 family)